MRLFVIVHLLASARSMYQKRTIGASYENAPKEKKLRENVSSLFCQNDVSGQRAATLFTDAYHADRRHVEDLKDIVSNNNTARSLLRKLSKNNRRGWPPLYMARIRVYDRKTQKIVRAWCPMLLPHELFFEMQRRSRVAALTTTAGMAADTKTHWQSCADQLPLPCVGCGIWCDGVPCNWDRSQSLECCSLYFPGFEGSFANLRLPLFVLPKRFLAKESSYEDAFAVLKWSFDHCGSGTFPSHRHDGTPWTNTDSYRKKHSGSLKICAVLCEMRGDWQMYSTLFRLGGWNKKKHCCWKCNVDKQNLANFGLDAAWRNQRISYMDFLVRLHQTGLSPSCLFNVPFFHIRIFKVDWLHTMDLGVASDWLGNLFSFVLPKLPGATADAKCSELFLRIQNYYSTHDDIPAKYDNMKLTMFRQGKKGYKLRGKASEVRGLINFAKLLADDVLSAADPVEATVLHGTSLLKQCYDHLSGAVPLGTLATSCRQFCILFKAMEDLNLGPKCWKVKPKAHLLCELCEFTADRPSATWCYRDEEFGGTLANLSRVRGGAVTPLAVGRNVLLKYMTFNRLPWLL